jgi:hypothetical protein
LASGLCCGFSSLVLIALFRRPGCRLVSWATRVYEPTPNRTRYS